MSNVEDIHLPLSLRDTVNHSIDIGLLADQQVPQLSGF